MISRRLQGRRLIGKNDEHRTHPERSIASGKSFSVDRGVRHSAMKSRSAVMQSKGLSDRIQYSALACLTFCGTAG